MLREEKQGLSSTDVDMKSTSCPVNSEKILKKFKTHMGAMDVDNNSKRTCCTRKVSDDVDFYLKD